MSNHWKWLFIASLIVFGKLAGFLKDVMITFYHGVSPVTDAYFLSGSIASFMYMAIYSSVPVLIVPLYSRLRASGSEGDVDKFLSAALVFFLTISIVVSVFVYAESSYLVDLFAQSIDENVRNLTIDYLSIMSITFALSTAVAFYNSAQTVNNNVVPSYLVPLVNNSFFCIGMLLFSSSNDFYKILILGVISWFALLVVNCKITRRWFSFNIDSPFIYFKDKDFMLLFLPAVLSFFVEYANGFVGVFFATELGSGAISILGYSTKLNMLLLSVFLVFITTSLFPKIAAVATQPDKDELSNYVLSCIRIIIIFGVPVVLFMIFYSREIVTLLFQRGQFLESDAFRVSSIFSVVLLSLPFSLVRDIMNRVYFAHSNTFIPLVLSVMSLMMNFSLSYVFYRQYGLIGLASSAVCSIVINCALMVFLVQRKFHFNFSFTVFKIISLCSLAGVGAYFLLKLLDASFSEYWLLLFLPSTLAYFGVLLFFRVREALLLVSFLKHIFRFA